MGQNNQRAPPPSPHNPLNVQCAQRNKVGGATAAADHLSKSGKVSTANSAAAAVDKRKKKKQPPAERPPDVCRDPITLDDLGSWTWDFRASEAATPPVSCGATKSTKGGGGWKGKGFGGGGKGGRGCGSGGSGGGGSGVSGSGSGSTSSAVVTYNVESLVLYLLESGDFQVRQFGVSILCCRCFWWCSRRCCDHG